jgi:hypothetical protein
MVAMRAIPIAVALALTACHTPGPVEVRTQEVVVTRVEHAITEAHVRENPPPAPLGPRPPNISAALDAALAKLCEWVAWGARSDALNQHAAGMRSAERVREPVCGVSQAD